MSQPRRDKFTATVTPEKPYQQKPLVQVEGKLTEAQLELMSKPKREKCTATVIPEKTSQQKPFAQVKGELTQAQLEAIAAGGININ